MSMILINTVRRTPGGGRANAVSSSGGCTHSINAADLRIMQPVAQESGLSMVLKLK